MNLTLKSKSNSFTGAQTDAVAVTFDGSGKLASIYIEVEITTGSSKIYLKKSGANHSLLLNTTTASMSGQYLTNVMQHPIHIENNDTITITQTGTGTKTAVLVSYILVS